jgi:hypothetical protein
MSGVTISEKVVTQDDRKVKIYIVKPQDVAGTRTNSVTFQALLS